MFSVYRNILHLALLTFSIGCFKKPIEEKKGETAKHIDHKCHRTKSPQTITNRSRTSNEQQPNNNKKQDKLKQAAVDTRRIKTAVQQ